MTAVGPKVSVVIVTYNQEQFIEKAVCSALSQQADFEYEIIVGEDCSTDGTRAVLSRLDADFPGRLRLLFRERNLGAACNFRDAYAECRGEYVAMLEGDDYWTDPAKLRKQVAVLDADPDCTLCYHLTRYISADEEPTGYVHPPQTTPHQPTIDDLFRCNLINTCSAVLRRAAVPEYPDWMLPLDPGDWPLFLLAADAGHLRRLDEVMASYRVHAGGMWSRLSDAARTERTFAMLSTIDRYFQGKYADQVDTGRIGVMNWLCNEMEHARRESTAAQQELAAVRHELQLNHQEKEVVRHNLALNQTELTAVRQELALNQTELTANRQELALNQMELTANRQELALNQMELTAVRQELALNQMELTAVRQELATINRARSLRLARAARAIPRRAVGWLRRPV